MAVAIAPYHIFRLGVKQSRTVSVTIAGVATPVIVEGDDYLDPITNNTVLDLNGLTANTVTATYGIRDGSIDMSFKERKLFETTTKGKHGGEFTDYQYQNRLIKLTLVVNIQPALTAGTPVSDYINNAVSSVRRLFNTAYSYSKSKGVQAGAAAIEGQPVILMVQLNASSNPVYFDVMGGEIDTKPLYDSVSYSAGYASFNVDIKCRYAGRGDLVYLQNAVINGNFVQDPYGKAQSYWTIANNDPTHGNFTFGDASIAPVLPIMSGTMQNNVLAFTGQSNVTSTVIGTQMTVFHNEQFILDFWYTCSSSSGNATGNALSVLVQYEEINSATDNTGPGGWATYYSTSLDLTNSGSGAAAPANGLAAHQGKRFTSSLVTLTSGYNASTNPNGLFNVRVVFSTVCAAGSENILFYVNQAALWRFPSYAPTRLKVAPTTEYVNVIPAIATDKLTTIYGIRGDTEAGCEIKAEPYWPANTVTLPKMQTLSLGMRQKIGAALPTYMPFAAGAHTNLSSGNTTWTQQIGSTAVVKADKRSRNYKIILVTSTSDVLGFGLKILRAGSTLFLNPILPSQIQPYLPSTGATGGPGTFTDAAVALDCGVAAIPADNSGNLATLHDTGTGTVVINALFNFLTGITGTVTSVNVKVYEMFFLPADQYCYIDTRHVLATGLYDTNAGWAAGFPLFINSTREKVETVIADFTALFSVSNTSPLHLNSPLRFYPAQPASWRQTDSTKPVSADDTMPMEIAFFPRLPDASQASYIAQDNNNNAGTDMMMYFKYYPLYGDLNGGN